MIKNSPIPSWLETPPSSTVSPPVDTKKQELPFHELSWEDFEKLCLRIVKEEEKVEEPKKKKYLFDCISPGEYESTYKCLNCDYTYQDKSELSYYAVKENDKHRQHKCTGIYPAVCKHPVEFGKWNPDTKTTWCTRCNIDTEIPF